MPQLFNNFLLNVIKYFLRSYDTSHNCRRSSRNSRIQAFDGKIDGRCVPGSARGPLTPSRPSCQRANEAAKEIRSANPNRGCTPLTGAEKSRAWLRHRIALQCSPGCLRSGFDSVQG
jgi:hypothetical protein